MDHLNLILIIFFTVGSCDRPCSDLNSPNAQDAGSCGSKPKDKDNEIQPGVIAPLINVNSSDINSTADTLFINTNIETVSRSPFIGCKSNEENVQVLQKRKDFTQLGLNNDQPFCNAVSEERDTESNIRHTTFI